jgi:hypothetical protein
MGSLHDSDLEPRAPIKRLAMLLVALLLVWVLILALLSKNRRQSGDGQRQELPVYYGAYEVQRKRAEAADWEMVQYRVEIAYPSTAVYEFYRKVFENQGWTRRPADQMPQWTLTPRRGKTDAVFDAAWVDPKQLRRIDLRLVAVPDEETMQVLCQRSRAVLPGTEPPPRR